MSEKISRVPDASPQEAANHIVHIMIELTNQMGLDEPLSVSIPQNVKRLGELEKMLGTIFSTERLKGYLSAENAEGPNTKIHVLSLRGLVAALIKDAFTTGQIRLCEKDRGTIQQTRFVEDCLNLITRKQISAQ